MVTVCTASLVNTDGEWNEPKHTTNRRLLQNCYSYMNRNRTELTMSEFSVFFPFV